MTNCHPEMFLGSHTKECTYRNNHNFRHDNCFCTCHPKNEKKKYHRRKGVCPNCYREYLLLTNWHDKSDWCPYCLDEFDD